MPAPSRIISALRRQLAAEIVRSLGVGSAYCVAPSYGIRQPRMSELERGIVDRCSVEWLIRRIERMGGTVQVTVTLGDAGRKWLTDRARR
jgi:predicted XRE-type DNA-binding protein